MHVSSQPARQQRTFMWSRHLWEGRRVDLVDHVSEETRRCFASHCARAWPTPAGRARLRRGPAFGRAPPLDALDLARQALRRWGNARPRGKTCVPRPGARARAGIVGQITREMSGPRGEEEDEVLDMPKLETVKFSSTLVFPAS